LNFSALVIVSAFLLSLNYLYYPLEIGEGEPLWRTILFGVGKIARAIFRILGMSIALWWWVVLLFMVIGLIAMQAWPNWAAVLLITGFLTLIYWFLGPYFRLAQAGLAIEIFRDENAATDPPEEVPEAIQMGSWDAYQKRLVEEAGAKDE
jgi:type VI protein secretion system component VasK